MVNAIQQQKANGSYLAAFQIVQAMLYMENSYVLEQTCNLSSFAAALH